MKRAPGHLALLLALLPLVAACAPGAGSSSSPNPSPTATQTGSITWAACPASDPTAGGNAELRCATLRVPRDYARADGPTIDLHLALLPATDPQRRVGPLLLNFGGPGASGIDILAESGRGVVPAALASRFDLVTWDPRGTGRSAPIDCLTDAELDDWIYADGIPAKPTAADWSAAASDAKWFAGKCEERSGDLIPYIGTTASARDMESIRAALGVAKLDYLGFSYGTSLGAVYATLFPASTGHLLLDGATDPAPTLDSEYGEQGVSIQGALDRLFSWCDANTDCGFGDGSARRAFDALLADAAKQPLKLDDGRSLTPGMIWTGVVLTLYNRDYWDYAVQALGGAANDGDGSLLATLADIYVDRNASGSYRSNIMESFPVISCMDHPTDGSVATFRSIYARFAKRAPDFASGQAAGGLLCGAFTLRNADPLPAVVDGAGAPAILVVGTTGDPATPYEWSVRLADALERGRLLTYEGEGHTGVGGKSTCIDAAAVDFLVDGTLPAEGTRCK